MTAKRTALYSEHCDLQARMTDFHGWEMPLQYAGILPEHRAVRTAAGLFDLGHMGRLRLHGPGALAFLERRISRPLASAEPGRVRYALALNERGTVEDDLLVSREAEERFHVVCNAGNRKKLKGMWAPGGSDGVQLEDLSEDQAMIAVQGPRAARLLADLGLDPGDLGYFRFREAHWEDVEVRLSRTGYTGEDGFECFCPEGAVVRLWRALLAAGATPCGLGARDTLRLEAGMPLYGHELDDEHTPIEAGLGFACGKSGDYKGFEVISRQRADGVAQRLVGLLGEGRRPARPGYPVLADATPVGKVTSGTWSPTLERPVAMAYVASEHAGSGTRLQVDLRGKDRLDAEVVPMPFYKRSDDK